MRGPAGFRTLLPLPAGTTADELIEHLRSVGIVARPEDVKILGNGGAIVGFRGGELIRMLNYLTSAAPLRGQTLQFQRSRGGQDKADRDMQFAGRESLTGLLRGKLVLN